MLNIRKYQGDPVQSVDGPVGPVGSFMGLPAFAELPPPNVIAPMHHIWFVLS